MKRKDFLTRTFQFGIGSLLLPGILNSCDRSNTLFEEVDYEGKVLIIGAGVAGAYAGYLLKEQGIDFSILEASGKYGGRMGKNNNWGPFPIDTGAQWLHGDSTILGAMVKSSGTVIFRDESAEQYFYRGNVVPDLPEELWAILDNIEDPEYADVTFEEYFFREGGAEEDRMFITALAGDSGASPDQISVRWDAAHYESISYGDDDHRFARTYFDLVEEQIFNRVRDQIQLHTVVEEIDYTGETIFVRDQNGQQYPADKVIVTVPITVLQDGDISFIPALSAAKTEAFQQVGMEAGIKAFMRFSDQFMEASTIGGEICAAYSLENYQRETSELVLMGFAMGEQGKVLSDMGEAAALQALLDELDEMFDGKASASFIDHLFVDWYKAPFIRGAYSYPRVGAKADTRHLIADAVDDKLFFAGEATNYNGHHQTVHGAVESAYREVRNLLKSLS